MVERDCDLLIAMTQTALDKFRGQLSDNGILIYDRSAMSEPVMGANQKVFGIDALEIANRAVGNPKCANSVVLGALATILVRGGYLNAEDAADFDRAFEEAVTENFGSKPKVVEQNIAAYKQGKLDI